MASSGKRTRGPNKQKPWTKEADQPLSVLRLPLDVSDPRQRHRLEALFSDAFSIRRALQRGARDACRAYRAAVHERARDPSAVRDRLGLSRTALEHRAYAHLDAAPHLRRGVTKAMAMHLADSVWTPVERHLFSDARGKRQGLLHVGRWFDFHRIPGRARSHTTPNKWETFRLHGSLAGHRAAYSNARGDFVQPTPLRPIGETAWWTYDGPLALVCTGLGVGPLVLPVRLPTAPSNQPILEHHLADPSRWHKVDLVRTRAPHAPGGWRYEAHLLVLVDPYVSPRTAERRARAAIETADRTAGIDVNVSNLTVASHEAGAAMRVTRIVRDEAARAADRRRTQREARRQRALDRSRRAANRAQYRLSKRQEKRARRREAAGMRPVEVVPRGPRIARSDGVPLQAFGRDTLTRHYRTLAAQQAAESEAARRSRRDHARTLAAEVVTTHGYQIVVEDTSIAAWSASWGRALAALSPGTIVRAIEREAAAVARIAGSNRPWLDRGLVRAATATTALSQHCPCGACVAKRLADRMHRCGACGLVGNRDAISAILGSFVVLAEPGVASSARVDYVASRTALDEIRRALRAAYQGWQDTLSESTDLSARDGSCVTGWMSMSGVCRAARRNVGTASCATRDEPGLGQATPERARMRTDMFQRYRPPWTYLRDKS